MARTKAKRDQGRGKGERLLVSKKRAAQDAELLNALDLLEERRAPYGELLQGIVIDTLEQFPPAPGGPIVEIGAGAGQLGEWLPPVLSARTVHTDPSERALRKLIQRAPNAKTNVASAERLPFDDGSVALVLGLCVFDAVGDEAAAVREIARVLCRGGRFVHFLDMATLLEGPFLQLAKTGFVPLPNVFGDPAEHEWPLDILLVPRDWLDGLLKLTERASHPLSREFGPYFALFLASPFNAKGATKVFKAMASSGDRRQALATILGSACQLAAQQGYPELQMLPFHSSRYLLSVLGTGFGQTDTFRIELARVVTRSTWHPAPPATSVRYRSLCLGHQRVASELPDYLLTESARTRLATDGAPPHENLVEAGMFVFVTQRI
jgi:SAM-dependent methyltransferase